MNSISTKTFCVVDHGAFLPVAQRLADSGAKVYYHNPSWMKAYPIMDEAIIGDGYPDFECAPDLWNIKDKVDCFVFPDIYHMGLQKELRKQGFPVWGSGAGMALETDRVFFLGKLEELGLDVPPHEVIVGITNLRAFLKDKKDIWIKMSKFRGSFETKHFRSYDLDEKLLDVWAFRFGGLKEHIKFICFPKIETELEIGADTYCIDGQWPSLMLHGIEAKDAAYLSAVTRQKDMPEQLLPIMQKLSPYMKESQYRCQWSMEVRVTDDADFFIDATCRGGLPSTNSQLMLWKNFPEIVYHGAQGELVEPIPAGKFSAECLISLSGERGAWESLVIPDSLSQNFRPSKCCNVGNKKWFMPDQMFESEQFNSYRDVGWLVAIGNTPTEVAENMNKLADELPDNCDADVESLAAIIREINTETEEGIHFTDMELPEPEIVLAE